MPRKRLPILQKLSNLLKVSIFVAKMRKPIIPKLIFLKKARRLKKFKLLKRYPYGSLLRALPSFTTTEVISRAEGFEISIRCSFFVAVWVA